MTPERWQEIKELLYQAQQLALDERACFLDRSCSSDRALRKEVEILLSSSDEARISFLENCPWQLTQTALAPGARLGAYEVRSLLGAGGMGEVYRAYDSKLARDVALKVLPPEMATDPNRLKRFQREARAVAALNHPNIVTIYSVEEAELAGGGFIHIFRDRAQFDASAFQVCNDADLILHIAGEPAEVVNDDELNGILRRFAECQHLLERGTVSRLC